jgi:TonB family protein
MIGLMPHVPGEIVCLLTLSLAVTALAQEEPVFRIGGGVSAPVLRSKQEPTHSEEAWKAGVIGTVILRLVVGSDGVPRDLEIVRGVGFGLEENAIDAVRKWRFEPGKREGKPVAVAATIEVNFLKGSPGARVARLTIDLPKDATRPELVSGHVPKLENRLSTERVKIAFDITALGIVENARVESGDVPPSVLLGILEWRFRPASVDGRPTRAAATLELP